MDQEKKPIEIFISYAIADSKRLKISEIIKELQKRNPKLVIHYWEGWNGFPDGNIIDFMESYIRASQIFIPICTKAMLKSKNCKKERDMASFQNKLIIPLFETFEFVPDVFQPYRGISILNKSITEVAGALNKQVITLTLPKAKYIHELQKEGSPKPRKAQITISDGFAVEVHPGAITGAVAIALTKITKNLNFPIKILYNFQFTDENGRSKTIALYIEDQNSTAKYGLEVPSVKTFARPGGVATYYACKRLLEAVQLEVIERGILFIPRIGSLGMKVRNLLKSAGDRITVIRLDQREAALLILSASDIPSSIAHRVVKVIIPQLIIPYTP